MAVAQHLLRGCFEILHNSQNSLPLAWQPGFTGNLRLRVGVSVCLPVTLSQSQLVAARLCLGLGVGLTALAAGKAGFLSRTMIANSN